MPLSPQQSATPIEERLAQALAGYPITAQWIPHAVMAAKKVRGLDGDGAIDRWFTLTILAVILRETLGGKAIGGPAGTGDNGHGHGLMQIDDRTWGDWLKQVDLDNEPLWQNPWMNIQKGAEILQLGYLWFPPGQHPYSEQAAVACYNAGKGGVQRGLDEAGNPDLHTTGKNYGADVLKHVAMWSTRCDF